MKIYLVTKKYLCENILDFIFYIVLSILMGLFNIIIPFLTGGFIDNIVFFKNTEYLYKFCIIFCLLFLCKIIIGYFLMMVYSKMQLKKSFDFNLDILRHLQRCPTSYLENENLVYLNNRINNDCNALIIYCLNIIQDILVKVISICFPIIVLFNINKVLTLCTVLSLVSYILIYFILKNYIYKINLEAFESLNIYFSKLQEQLNYAYFAKVFGIIDILNLRILTTYRSMEEKNLNKQKINYCYSSVENIFHLLLNLVIILYGGIGIINGSFSIGQFTIFSNYFSMLLSSVSYFFHFGKNYQDILVSYNRIDEVLNIKTEEVGEQKLNKIETIKFNNLEYCIGNKKMFNKMTVQLKKKNMYGVIGENGSGKTTLLKLLLTVYKVEKNDMLLYNEISSDNIDMVFLRKNKIAFVGQENMFFNDTLIYNFYFRKDVTIEEKNRIIENLIFFEIDYLMNYMYEILDYTLLSGGEKQKLSIIRALLKEQADILMLDEPTSALDVGCKKKLIHKLMELKKEKLIILITHDMEMIKACDKILRI